MKILFDDEVTLVTPCFCSGADQNIAEIRASSIRGEWRWWFRALGASAKEEVEVFGGIGGTAQASKVIVRVSDVRKKNSPVLLPKNLKFFLKSRGESCVPEGSVFKLTVLSKQNDITPLASLSLEIVLRLGGIGLRSNRGCGAMQAKDYRPTKDKFIEWAKVLADNDVQLFCLQETEKSAYGALQILEEHINNFRSEMGVEKNAKNALGYVQGNKRHSSCLRVRPVILSDQTFLPVFIYSDAALAPGVKSILPELTMYF